MAEQAYSARSGGDNVDLNKLETETETDTETEATSFASSNTLLAGVSALINGTLWVLPSLAIFEREHVRAVRHYYQPRPLGRGILPFYVCIAFPISCII